MPQGGEGSSSLGRESSAPAASLGMLKDRDPSLGTPRQGLHTSWAGHSSWGTCPHGMEELAAQILLDP